MRSKSFRLIRPINPDSDSDSDEPNNKIEKVFTLQLVGIQLREIERGSKSVIVLFRPDGANVHQNFKELELTFENADDFKSWKKSLSFALNGGKSVSFGIPLSSVCIMHEYLFKRRVKLNLFCLFFNEKRSWTRKR